MNSRLPFHSTTALIKESLIPLGLAGAAYMSQKSIEYVNEINTLKINDKKNINLYNLTILAIVDTAALAYVLMRSLGKMYHMPEIGVAFTCLAFLASVIAIHFLKTAITSEFKELGSGALQCGLIVAGSLFCMNLCRRNVHQDSQPGAASINRHGVTR